MNLQQSNHPTHKLNSNDQNYTAPLVVLTSLFFMWGFLTALNDILIPHLKSVFTLSYTEAMLVQFVFFAAYFIVSLPAGSLVEKIGYKKGIILGLLISGVACLVFYPAASMRNYPLFLTAFFFLAAGITILQVAANPFVAVLGKPETASSRLNLTQAFNSLGTTIAPLVGAMLILSTAVLSPEQMTELTPEKLEAYKNQEAASVQIPYLFLAGSLFLIAILIGFFKLPQVSSAGEEAAEYSEITHFESVYKYKHLILGAVAIFVYVGAEVAIGSFLVNYLGEKEVAGLTEEQAGKYVSLYWGGAMVGRFIGAVVMRKVSPSKILGFNAIIAGVLVITTILSSGSIAMWSILAVGLFNSIMFPTIFTLSLAGLGKHTGKGSGVLCMAIVGGAILPVLQGYFADNIGIKLAFFLPVLCYVYISYFGFAGSDSSYLKKVRSY